MTNAERQSKIELGSASDESPGSAPDDSVDRELFADDDETMNGRISALENDMAAVKSDLAVMRATNVTKDDLTREIGLLRVEMHKEFGALRTEVQHEIGALRTEMNREIGALRSEMNREIGALRSDLNRETGVLGSEIGTLRTDMYREIGTLRADMYREFGSLRADMAALEATILKWFIATAVTLAGLAFAAGRFIH